MQEAQEACAGKSIPLREEGDGLGVDRRVAVLELARSGPLPADGQTGPVERPDVYVERIRQGPRRYVVEQ